MKIVPNTKQPQIGSLLEFQNDDKKYIIDREGGDDYWVLREGTSTFCLIYKNKLIKDLLEHKIKILN